MARLSNAQGLMFAEISTEEIGGESTTTTTLKGWFGAQQVGQVKSLITNIVNEQKGVVTHTVGDAILSSFADAQAALTAALGIQQKVAKAQNPSKGTVVKVRIGLAYGPVRVLAGKVSGDSVTAAGVLLEKAQPSEIMADQAMLDAVGLANKDVRFENCGLMDGIAAYRVVPLAVGTRTISEAAPVAPRPQAATIPPPAPAPVHHSAATIPPPAPAPVHPPAATIPPPAPAAAVSPGTQTHGDGAPAVAVLLKFGRIERRFTAADGEIVIGRGKDAHISVPEIHVSRKHVKIVWEDGRFPHLVNLSQNGACVRFTETGLEQTCTDNKVPLEGSGEIALCGRFSQVSSPGEIVRFSLLSD